MVIPLAVGADALMLGNYFNRFYEAAAEKYDASGNPTTVESEMVEVATWGEGSERARNLDRYGHSTQKTFFPEGVEARVHYEGRLKPFLKKDLIKIKAAMVNAGCFSLEQLRAEARLQALSPEGYATVKDVHSLKSCLR
jgi:IMP dehydrogenase/GMP reductase